MDQVHEKAKTGFLDGESYERSRPSYTDEVVKQISELIQEDKAPGAIPIHDCLELGAGTGKFTEKIIKYLPKNIKYLATEPMSGFLDTLKAKCPELETMQCPATKIPLPDTSVKTVVAAQCFHWFATEEALNEIHRVLVPDGKLVLVWNKRLWNVPLLRDIDSVVSEYYGNDTPRYKHQKWRNLIEEFPRFQCIKHSILDGIQWRGSRHEVVDHINTMSVVSALDDETKQVVQQRIRDVLNKYFDQSIHDIDLPFETELIVLSKV